MKGFTDDFTISMTAIYPGTNKVTVIILIHHKLAVTVYTSLCSQVTFFNTIKWAVCSLLDFSVFHLCP